MRLLIVTTVRDCVSSITGWGVRGYLSLPQVIVIVLSHGGLLIVTTVCNCYSFITEWGLGSEGVLIVTIGNCIVTTGNSFCLIAWLGYLCLPQVIVLVLLLWGGGLIITTGNCYSSIMRGRYLSLPQVIALVLPLSRGVGVGVTYRYHR